MIRNLFMALILSGVLLALICQGIISYDIPAIAGLTDWYGAGVSRFAPVKVIRPGWVRTDIIGDEEKRDLETGRWQGIAWTDLDSVSQRAEGLLTVAVTPDAVRFDDIIDGCRKRKVKIVVESSGIDGWHTTSEGYAGLVRLRGSALRVVIFDGGHHLPTLGLSPDIIIVPSTAGFAAHSQTRDGVAVNKLVAILEREKLDCPVVSVPRWGLVKTEAAMNIIAVRALKEIPGGRRGQAAAGHIMGTSLSVWGDTAFWYISRADRKHWQLSAFRLKKFAVTHIYAAFDYDKVRKDQIDDFKQIMRRSGIEITVANEPVNVFGALIRGG